jgi:hypothetical protein
VNPGQSVPLGSTFTFNLDLSDPQIAGHLARSLAAGRLSLMVSSLSPAKQATPGGTGFGGNGAYPQWSTREDNLFPGPVLEVEGTLIGDVDADGDAIALMNWKQVALRRSPPGGRGRSGRRWFSEPGGMGGRHGPALRCGSSFGSRPGGTETGFRPWGFRVRPNRIYPVERDPDLVQWAPAGGNAGPPSPTPGLAVWSGSVPTQSHRPGSWRASVRA